MKQIPFQFFAGYNESQQQEEKKKTLNEDFFGNNNNDINCQIEFDCDDMYVCVCVWESHFHCVCRYLWHESMLCAV